jgi:hypothetical protein
MAQLLIHTGQLSTDGTATDPHLSVIQVMAQLLIHTGQ